MRNWPYAYALGHEGQEGQGQVRGRPFPEFEGGGKAGILGGHNSVISAYSKNPGGALKLIDYLTLGGDRGRKYAAKFSLPPVLDGDLRRPGGQEGAAVRDRAQAGGRAGQVPPGLAGLPADLAGDLQERQRGSVGRDPPEDALKKAQSRHGQGTGHLLGRHGSRHHPGGHTAEAALPGNPGAPPRGAHGVAVD